MAKLRPSVNADDSIIQTIIKYIPAEIVAIYPALVGYFNVNPNTVIPPHYITYYVIIVVVLFIFTLVWTYFGVIDNKTAALKKLNTHALFHAIIAGIAFLIWIYAIGNSLLKAFLCGCINTDCDDCGIYSPVLGAIFLALFTLLTPIIERIFLGPKQNWK